jgi:hypothetical protein
MTWEEIKERIINEDQDVIPEKLNSGSPSEVLEYHILALKEMCALPQDFNYQMKQENT